MALLLHIETATTVCSVALSDNDKLLVRRELNEGYTHAENLTVFIREVVEEAGRNFHDIDAVAISKGPGSYTGLRIGYSAAKGLCYALEKPLVAVDTLLVMAKHYLMLFPGTKDALLCPMIDARRMEVYCALYDSSLNTVEPVSAKIIDEHSFAEYLQSRRIIFFGDGSSKCSALFSGHPHATIEAGVFPSAVAMIQPAFEKFRQGQFEDLAYCEPFYLKDFVAGAKATK